MKFVRRKYLIGNKKLDSYLYIDMDKYVSLSTDQYYHDVFDILFFDDNIIKIKFSVLPKYCLQEKNGRIVLSFDDEYNVYKLIPKEENVYAIISVSSNKALTIGKDRCIFLEDFDCNNSNQEFVLEDVTDFFTFSESLCFIC